MTDDEEAFIATIRENPNDHTSRLVYADWLEERGEADRGEYLRIIVKIAEPLHQSVPMDVLSHRLRTVSKTIQKDWRERVSYSYRVFLEWFDPTDLISLVRLLRMRFGFNLSESHALTLRLPAQLPAVLTREEADEIKTNFEAGYWSQNPSAEQVKQRSVPLCRIRIDPASDG